MTTMVLEHEDAFLEEDKDAPFYGFHSPKAGIPTDRELTVQDILDRRPPAEILNSGPSRRTRADRERGPSTTEIRHRLELERLATEQEKTDIVGPNWWEADSGGILLKPRYPAGPPKGNDVDATVGFMPFAGTPQPDQRGFVYDEPPIGHETGGHPLTAIMDRMDPIPRKRPPLWKQALIGLGLMRE